jgi:alginate O-acetyltransferase complex protein AlgI
MRGSAFNSSTYLHKTVFDLAIAASVLIIALLASLAKHRGGGQPLLERQPVWLRWPVYYAVLLSIVLLGVYGHSTFIYFKF